MPWCYCSRYFSVFDIQWQPQRGEDVPLFSHERYNPQTTVHDRCTTLSRRLNKHMTIISFAGIRATVRAILKKRIFGKLTLYLRPYGLRRLGRSLPRFYHGIYSFVQFTVFTAFHDVISASEIEIYCIPGSLGVRMRHSKPPLGACVYLAVSHRLRSLQSMAASLSFFSKEGWSFYAL